MGIVHQLRQAKGTNTKLAILKKNSGNEDWLNVLKAMYDSSINYYVSAPKDNSFVDSVNVPAMLIGLRMLSERRVTGNKARDHALHLSRTYGEILRLILGGSLKAGVSVTTINKAYPNLIPTFDVMLAEKDLPVTYPCWGSIKYDGVRVVVRVKDSVATARTRAGKELPVVSLLAEMSLQTEGWYDGELVDGDGKQAGRSNITGSVNKILKGTATDIEDYTFCIFDKVSLEEWEMKKSFTDFYDRLENLFTDFHPHNHIYPVSTRVLNSPEEVSEYYKELRALGYEGAILRYPEDKYEWKRSPALIKLKAKIPCILKCVDVTEGKGKYEGMIGALVCEGNIDGKEVRVKLGTGLSDFDRELMPEDYIGKDIDAEYNDIVIAEGAEYYSLFLPVFKRIKGDYNI